MTSATRGAIRWGWVAIIGVVALVLLIASSRTCLRTGFSSGLWLDHCPDGDIRQTITLNASGLSRGARASINFTALGHYAYGPGEQSAVEAIEKFVPTLTLVNGSEKTVLTPEKGWQKSGPTQFGEVVLPAVPDGDYVLHADVTSTVGTTSIDLPLALYAPARVHVLTDRPLYEPGNTVKFRAVALKASDLSPLDNRPGKWRVTNANNEVLLEEKAPAGKWGVVSGSFPLDKQAESGTWTVAWISGATTESRSFTVKPFTLPRFRVEAAAQKSYYRKNEKPVLTGSVHYASGAPVANAKIELTWTVSGEWPAPTAWNDGTAFPKTADVTAAGTFTVNLPTIPEDLQKQSTLNVNIAAVDSTGDRVESSASILLSADPIAVTTVTELGDGLVEGFNNRMFLRATMADGSLLRGVTLNVKRLWEATDKGVNADVDEDGVASLQIDPGPAVNVVIPAMPFRPPPKTPAVTMADVSEVLEGDVSLGDRLVLDRALTSLESCAQYVGSAGSQVQVGFSLNTEGSIVGLASGIGRLADCVKPKMSSLHFSSGKVRLLTVTWNFDDSELPKLDAAIQSIPQGESNIETAIAMATEGARDCLPALTPSMELNQQLLWKVTAKSKDISVTWAKSEGKALGESAMSCLKSRLAHLTFPPAEPGEPAESALPQADAVGTATFSITAPEKYEASRPQPTIQQGYEFLVTAKAKNEVIGSTHVFVRPGTIPNMRLRASNQLVKPGETITVEMVRGPDFQGELPKKLSLFHGYKSWESDVDEKTRSAKFTLDPTLEGWASVEYGDARVFIFIQPKSQLAVTVAAEKERYAPGQMANLKVSTTIAGTGGEAAVGLFGVDESLSQLAALPGADEMSGMRPKVQSAVALGGLDAQALSLGRIRGANAAAATLLRVSARPPPAEMEGAVNVNGQSIFDPNEALVDRFYVVLAALHLQARDWEASAPAGEKMTNKTMASLWAKAIDSVEAKKESARDAYNRPLRLHRLPSDLLALTEPRQVIITGTRLPEDTENWSAWVAKEKP